MKRGGGFVFCYPRCGVLWRSGTAGEIRARKPLSPPPRFPDAGEPDEPLAPEPTDPPSTGA